MVIFGVDPGTATTGYGVIEATGSARITAVAYGVVTTPPRSAPELRLQEIHRQLGELILQHGPDAVAIEEIYFKNNISTGIAVAQARGVAMLAAAHAGIAVASYKPAEVKQAISGSGNAAKNQVRYMTQVLLALPEKPHPDDAADALAVAVCHAQRAPAEARIAEAAAATR